MALVEESADLVALFEARDALPSGDDGAGCIGAWDDGEIEWEGVLSLGRSRGGINIRATMRSCLRGLQSRCLAYLRDDQISIIERDGVYLDETVMIAQGRKFDGSVELQTFKAIPSSFNNPLRCGEGRHC